MISRLEDTVYSVGCSQWRTSRSGWTTASWKAKNYFLVILSRRPKIDFEMRFQLARKQCIWSTQFLLPTVFSGGSREGSGSSNPLIQTKNSPVSNGFPNYTAPFWKPELRFFQNPNIFLHKILDPLLLPLVTIPPTACVTHTSGCNGVARSNYIRSVQDSW